MRKPWLFVLWAVLVVSMIGVMLWAGLLGYRWHEGYRVGQLIIIDAIADDHPGNIVQGQQRIQAWKELEIRRNEIEQGLSRLNDWQRTAAFTTAFDTWRECNPRPGFGTLELWNLLAKHNRRDFMEQMLKVPVTKRPIIGSARTRTLKDIILDVGYENGFQMQLLGPDRPADEELHYPVLGQPLRDEMGLFTSSVGLSWDIIDSIVAIGTAEELSEFRRRVAAREARLARLEGSRFSEMHPIAEKLRDPVTLEFVETPLKDVNNFLSDYGGFNCLALNTRSPGLDDADDQLADKLVTVQVQGTLGMALDCLTMQNGFDWDVVDGFLCMGEVTAIQSFRRRLSQFDRKLAHADEVLLKFLQSPLVTLSPGRETLNTGANGSVYGSVYAKRIGPGEYSAASIVEFFWATMVVYGPPSEFGTPLVCFSRNELAFYRALDVVCALTDMDWEVQADGSIRLVEVGK